MSPMTLHHGGLYFALPLIPSRVVCTEGEHTYIHASIWTESVDG